MNFDQMRNIELKKELKKRGLKGYSSLRKAQLIDYLSTGIHPLKKTETPSTIAEGEIHDSPSDSIRYSPT
ncbi:MAG: SAP domain-containing protein, partial [Candidatus Poribacteria bacterium]|nr:SAP domain-containing protein [Candidatus Poribacteria bacterium]